MLKRIYIDNFRGFVNFELSLESINLFLGPNGAGKSTVFDVLRKIQRFVNGDKVFNIFDRSDLTRWQSSSIQTFELDVKGNGGIYKYQFGIEYKQDGVMSRIQIVHEYLWFNKQQLLKSDAENAELFNEQLSGNSTFPSNKIFSIIPLVTSASNKEYSKLTWFKERLERLIIVQINPMLMAGDSQREEPFLTSKMENFVSWYRFIENNQKGKIDEVTEALKEILDGFEAFRFIEVGEQHRFLNLRFSNENKNNGKRSEYLFTELSDGQRVLIALYTLIFYTQSQDYTLCIDEPENFVALPEIQPWLTLLYDLCNERKLQALLISHNSELIDYLASFAGYWFDYQNNTPVQVKRITEDEEAGIPISELIARGWLYG